MFPYQRAKLRFFDDDRYRQPASPFISSGIAPMAEQVRPNVLNGRWSVLPTSDLDTTRGRNQNRRTVVYSQFRHVVAACPSKLKLIMRLIVIT